MNSFQDKLRASRQGRSVAGDEVRHDPSNGRFTSGSGSSGESSAPRKSLADDPKFMKGLNRMEGLRNAENKFQQTLKANPGMAPERARAIAGGAKPNHYEVSRSKNR